MTAQIEAATNLCRRSEQMLVNKTMWNVNRLVNVYTSLSVRDTEPQRVGQGLSSWRPSFMNKMTPLHIRQPNRHIQ